EKGFFDEFYQQLPRYSAKWSIEKEAYTDARSFFKDTLGFWSTPAADASAFETYRLAAERIQSLADVFLPQLDEYKARTGQMTMADLESVSGDAVAKQPHVARAFAAEWDYWLIDEFQDTSPFQISLLDALIGDRRRCVVGDPQQSIYLLRGARYEV